MSELRPIDTKHKIEDAAQLRRAVAELDNGRRSMDVLQLLLYALNQAERIEHAFRKPPRAA